MKLRKLKDKYKCCKIKDIQDLNFNCDYVFIFKTPNELSLFCIDNLKLNGVTETENGFCCFAVDGKLDFSLTGIIYNITKILAYLKIPVCAVSTFDTDYFFIKEENCVKAEKAFKENGYDI